MEKVEEDIEEMVVASYNYSTDHNMPLNYPVDKQSPLGDPSSAGGSIVFNQLATCGCFRLGIM